MDFISNLENGVESDDEIIEERKIDENFYDLKIQNPFFRKKEFFIQGESIDINQLTVRECLMKFDKLLILCLKNGNRINSDFYKEVMSLDKFDEYSKKLVLIEANKKMLYNIVHKKNVILLNSSYLEKLNHYNLELNEQELILPLINLVEEDVNLYKKQYDGMFDISDYLKIQVINKFYKNTSFSKLRFSVELLDSLVESNYWTNSRNCKLNITTKFMERGFKLSKMSDRIKNDELKKTLNELSSETHEENDYLSFLHQKEKYVDVSSVLKKNGYSLYRINDNVTLDKTDMSYMFNSITTRWELYKLVTNMLISKDYSHLILNNEQILDKLRDYRLLDSLTKAEIKMGISFIEKYLLAFKYCMGYAWISYYTEESIKKTMIQDNDRFVFSINTASKLPHIPFTRETYFDSPYLPILINSDVLNIKQNCVALDTFEHEYGVVDFETFKLRFNEFTTGNQNYDILEGLNWNNLAISGSVIPACITRFNPLMTKFVNVINKKTKLNRYFNEYYSTSDIDIMCNLKDDFDYIDKAYEFYQKLCENYEKLNLSKSSISVSYTETKESIEEDTKNEDVFF